MLLAGLVLYTSMMISDCLPKPAPQHIHCPFSGRGDSSSVMFCGSFHACATYLINDISQSRPFCPVPDRSPVVSASEEEEEA